MTIVYRTLANADCDEKRNYICMTETLEANHDKLCPPYFISYKGECYYHSMVKGDYNKSELLCAEKASIIAPIKDRATFHFLRSWSMKESFGDFYLGFNYTTGDPAAPVKYSDGTAYNKSTDYAFDDNSEKFGQKECNYMKKGVQFKPRDSECSVNMAPICLWKSKYCFEHHISSRHETFFLSSRTHMSSRLRAQCWRERWQKLLCSCQ